MSRVLFPSMRAEIVRALAVLSDPDFQWRVWVRRELPEPSYYNNLDLNVHILFDDTEVLPDPTAEVEFHIYADEVDSLGRLGLVLGPLISHLGDVSDERYITDPRWPEVVERAKVALEVMRRNDAEFGTGIEDVGDTRNAEGPADGE